VRVTRERAIGNHLDFGQKVRKAACQGGLRRSAPASNQDPPYLVADGVQKEALLYLVLAHNGSERKHRIFPVQLSPSSMTRLNKTEHIGSRTILFLHILFDPAVTLSFSMLVL
jgi:hypothetical protein